MIKTLLVDDEKSFLDLAEAYLTKENENMKLKTINSPKKAFKLVKRNEFDCIVSDYQMPGLNGLELLEKVRNKLDNDIPFVVFTGKGREEVAIKALNKGADRYIKKGGDPKTQFGVLSRAIKQESKLYKFRNELEEQRLYFKELFKSSPEAIVLVDEDGNVIDINNSFKNLFQYKLDEIKGEYIDEYVAHDEKIKEANIIADRTLEGEVVEKETIRKKKDGTTFPVMLISYPIKLNDEVQGAFGIYRDISKRKKRERKLKESRKDYKELIGGMNDAVLVHDLEGNFLEVNKKAAEKLGYSKDELLSKKIQHLEDSFESEEIKQRIQGMEEGSVKVFETQYLTKNREKIPVEVNSSLITYKGDLTVLNIARDIKDRKRREEKLKEYKKAIEGSEDLLVAIDSEYKYIFANKKYLDFVGINKEKNLIGKSLSEIYSGEELKEIKKKVDKCLQGKTIQYEMTRSRENKKYFDIRYFPLKEEKEVTGVVGVLRDITERKNTEERDNFLYSLLRHDVQNKNQVIQGYLELLKEKDLPEEVEKYIEKTLKATKESKDIIEKVSTLKKIKEEEIQEINILSILKESIKEYRSLANKYEIKIELISHKKDCMAQGGSLLKTVFGNLIENSIKHSKGNKIKVTYLELDENCIVKIEDDGKGISKKLKKKIFQKGIKEGKNAGTGLGMYLVKQILKIYNGEIRIEESDLGGTKFKIKLNKK
ncbi:MAG: Signal transduction histidine kinase containing PAS domain [Candidatus Methanohalarchaeum thermophilum]|uniref:histidine kinase n=1 Tax=Methanohalarchaeum thermophilum TaxID=1903181 RepID=A0A1Q6DVT5_METT1|nr:MAG: Signal transduction histidine kinase containing PAS domain [Candidatus Methanohalarchaeum thermophilum]